MKDKDLEEGTPDHPGEPLETAEVNGDSGAGKDSVARAPRPRMPAVREMWCKRRCGRASRWQALEASQLPLGNEPAADADARAAKLPATGTVVLDVEQGGIEVPSFVGKTVRGAVEAAQDAGLELEAVGSGVARQQSPRRERT